MRFEISFTGHQNIRSLHQRTIEITRDPDLTPGGDCIVGVNASAACGDLPDGLKKRLQDPQTTARFSIVVGGQTFSFEGRGHPGLELSHPGDIVIRKSAFTCPRTVAVKSDKASDSLPRDMIRALRDPKTTGSLVIEIA